jgi:hypothetical protein
VSGIAAGSRACGPDRPPSHPPHARAKTAMICSCVNHFLFISPVLQSRPDANPRWRKLPLAGQNLANPRSGRFTFKSPRSRYAPALDLNNIVYRCTFYHRRGIAGSVPLIRMA